MSGSAVGFWAWVLAMLKVNGSHHGTRGCSCRALRDDNIERLWVVVRVWFEEKAA